MQRNDLRFPAIVTLDPRIARDIPLGRVKAQIIWEAFNIFNRDNIINGRTCIFADGNDADADGRLRAAARECGRADHAACGETVVLSHSGQSGGDRFASTERIIRA